MLRVLEGMQSELHFTVEVIDVDSDPALEARYGEYVPVLVDPDGLEICHYFLDLTALTDRLAVR